MALDAVVGPQWLGSEFALFTVTVLSAAINAGILYLIGAALGKAFSSARTRS